MVVIGGENKSMKKNWFMSFLVLISTLAIISCSGILSFDKEAQFNKLISIPEMNTKLRFEKPDPTMNTFKIGDTLNLTVDNKSKDNIEFRIDSGLKILYYNNNSHTWENEANEGSYVPSDAHPIIEPETPGVPPGLDIPLTPEINTNLDNVTIRVVAIGQIIGADGKPGEKVASYIDVNLHK